ncbi:MAG: hypothetical protein DIZ77_16190 [endosymbiont of Seepiophila jonesi]|uniref:RlmG N-terminal domain-containing protein n=1 Tax=endosymbiont of Lamellibrachia luymesi TaxID=2200907 RepID=A0A370E353_9GAMM|nr:MAG: hypothetical protein DIZ77_16190 [endosymbiont of Seepiophila jonesi]RDH93088.1 MAG: hypothetical protein DIZ79_01695 [endosymbiont of Lamellibrachia luymesi]
MAHFSTPFGKFLLSRYPKRKKETLRAWDAADEYLLSFLAEKDLLSQSSKILILNDSFGALGTALALFSPVSQGDLFIAEEATRVNLSANGLPVDAVTIIDSLQTHRTRYDLVLVRVTKTLALLVEDFQGLEWVKILADKVIESISKLLTPALQKVRINASIGIAL